MTRSYEAVQSALVICGCCAGLAVLLQLVSAVAIFAFGWHPPKWLVE